MTPQARSAAVGVACVARPGKSAEVRGSGPSCAKVLLRHCPAADYDARVRVLSISHRHMFP